MKSVLVACVAAVLFVAWPARGQAGDVAARGLITVRVVDERGEPVQGAEVGSMAIGSGAGNESRPLHLGFYGAKDEPMHLSGADGRVEIDPKWVFYGADDTRPQAIMARTLDGTRIGLLKVIQTDAGSEKELKIAAACRVTVKLSSSGLQAMGRKITWANVYVFWQETRPIACDSTTGVHEFFLPPGEYKLYAYGTDTYTEQPLLKVEPGEKERTVEVDLSPNRLAQLIGKQAPELVKIKGWKNGEPVTLASLKGKVVLLDFWGHWCGPCIHSMPKLMEVHDAYKDKGLVIIAVHDDSVASIAEMDDKLEKVKADVWKGRDLPFLIALDGGGEVPIERTRLTARGATTAAYGISSFPTTVLIDRAGNVVGRINIKDTGSMERAMELPK